jgi:APA family basic amino acid/polyamine antiporter
VGWSALPEAPSPVAGGSFALGPFVVSLMWISLSYSGWNAAVYIGGEARDAERTLPRSLLFGTLVVTALYLGLNWIFVHAAPVERLAGQQDIAAVAAGALGGPRLESVVRGVLVVALFTSVSSMVMIGPRVYARMAEDGLFPRLFAFDGEVPSAAIWLQVTLSVAVLWASGLRAQLSNLGWILSLFTAITVIGLIRLRLREGPERVRVPGWPIVPGLFVGAVLVLTGIMATVATAELLPAGVVLATGAVAYAWFGRRAARSPRRPN